MSENFDQLKLHIDPVMIMPLKPAARAVLAQAAVAELTVLQAQIPAAVGVHRAEVAAQLVAAEVEDDRLLLALPNLEQA